MKHKTVDMNEIEDGEMELPLDESEQEQEQAQEESAQEQEIKETEQRDFSEQTEKQGDSETQEDKNEAGKQLQESSQKVKAVSPTGAEYLKAETAEKKWRLADAFFKGGMVPKSYENPTQVFAGLEMARELDVPPLIGLKNIAVIHGSPSIWGDLPLALVRRSGKLTKKEEFLFDENYNKICFDNKNLDKKAHGAICRTWRGSDPEPWETTFTMKDADKAGLLGRNNVWKTYPKRMLQMRARSKNLKDQFPDVLLGIDIAEYDWNTIPGNLNIKNIGRDGEPKRDVAGELNSSVKKEESND